MMPTLLFLKQMNFANAMHLLIILQGFDYVQLKVFHQDILFQTHTDSSFFSGVHSMCFFVL